MSERQREKEHWLSYGVGVNSTAIAGGTWAKFREQHGDALGITCTRAKDLTAEQALKVHAMLKQAETAGAA